MSMRLRDRVVIITGGSQGIGEAFARRFAGEGAKVAIVNRDQKKATAVVNSIRRAGGEAMAIQANVGRVADIDAAVRHVVDAYGTVQRSLRHSRTALVASRFAFFAISRRRSTFPTTGACCSIDATFPRCPASTGARCAG